MFACFQPHVSYTYVSYKKKTCRRGKTKEHNSRGSAWVVSGISKATITFGSLIFNSGLKSRNDIFCDYTWKFVNKGFSSLTLYCAPLWSMKQSPTYYILYSFHQVSESNIFLGLIKNLVWLGFVVFYLYDISKLTTWYIRTWIEQSDVLPLCLQVLFLGHCAEKSLSNVVSVIVCKSVIIRLLWTVVEINLVFYENNTCRNSKIPLVLLPTGQSYGSICVCSFTEVSRMENSYLDYHRNQTTQDNPASWLYFCLLTT